MAARLRERSARSRPPASAVATVPSAEPRAMSSAGVTPGQWSLGVTVVVVRVALAVAVASWTTVGMPPAIPSVVMVTAATLAYDVSVLAVSVFLPNSMVNTPGTLTVGCVHGPNGMGMTVGT